MKLIIAWRVITLFLLSIGLGAVASGYSAHPGWTIGFALLLSALSAGLAMMKKANVGWATVYGLTWGLFSVLYYLVLPKQDEEKSLGYYSREAYKEIGKRDDK